MLKSCDPQQNRGHNCYSVTYFVKIICQDMSERYPKKIIRNKTMRVLSHEKKIVSGEQNMENCFLKDL